MLLADFRTGYLQSDAYSVYDRIHARGILEVGCMAHARRKFDEAKKHRRRTISWGTGLDRICLYQIERAIKERIEKTIAELARSGPVDAAIRRQLRRERSRFPQRDKEQSRPLMAEFGEWLETAAVHAAQEPDRAGNRRRAVKLDGIDAVSGRGILIDRQQRGRARNAANRLGKKNWLHLGSDKGGRTAAVLMSIVQSCQALNVEQCAYLREVYDRVSTHPANRIADLLPDAWQAARL